MVAFMVDGSFNGL